MRIIFIGDVVGDNGKDILRRGLPLIKRQYDADVCIVNGENSNSSGTGMNREDSKELLGSGADIITGGNHSLRRASIDLYSENEFLLCPANFLGADKECGVCTLDLGKDSICVINLIGTAFMDSHANPFLRLDAILETVECKTVLVDFHRESTAEKKAFGYYADGRVSRVVGTHTHVQTNDETILPKGTAYITDAGCVAAEDSVLGVEISRAVEKQKLLRPARFKVREGKGYICGVFIETDEKGSALKISKIRSFF